MSEWVEKEEVLNQINCWFTTGEYKYSNATHYLNKRISSIKPKIKWISVNDRLPDDDVLVLVYTKDGVVSVCSRVIANAFTNLKNSKVWEDNNGYYLSDVTHWMSLPQSPESEDDAENSCMKEASEGEWIIHFDDLFPEESTQDSVTHH